MSSSPPAIEVPTAPPAPVLPEKPVHSYRTIPWLATWVVIVAAAAIVNTPMIYATGGQRGFFMPVLMTCACLVAALFDGWTHRIPNPLTYTTIVLGLLINAAAPVASSVAPASGVWLAAPGIGESAIGFACGAILFLIANLLKGNMGGDLKLLAAMGATLGISSTVTIALLAMGLALCYAFLNLLVRGRLHRVLQTACHHLLELVYYRRLQSPMPEPLPASYFPMALPMAVALVIALVLQLRSGPFGALV